MCIFTLLSNMKLKEVHIAIWRNDIFICFASMQDHLLPKTCLQCQGFTRNLLMFHQQAQRKLNTAFKANNKSTQTYMFSYQTEKLRLIQIVEQAWWLILPETLSRTRPWHQSKAVHSSSVVEQFSTLHDWMFHRSVLEMWDLGSQHRWLVHDVGTWKQRR